MKHVKKCSSRNTELGVLNPQPPRLVTSFKRVERGTSGGISPLGSLAAAGGALLIGSLAALLTPAGLESSRIFLQLVMMVTLAGVCGSFFDSLLGATVQSIYYCPSCAKETERFPLHTCGTNTIHQRGWRWLNNDTVNFMASLAGGVVSVGLWWLSGSWYIDLSADFAHHPVERYDAIRQSVPPGFMPDTFDDEIP